MPLCLKLYTTRSGHAHCNSMIRHKPTVWRKTNFLSSVEYRFSRKPNFQTFPEITGTQNKKRQSFMTSSIIHAYMTSVASIPIWTSCNNWPSATTILSSHLFITGAKGHRLISFFNSAPRLSYSRRSFDAVSLRRSASRHTLRMSFTKLMGCSQKKI